MAERPLGDTIMLLLLERGSLFQPGIRMELRPTSPLSVVPLEGPLRRSTCIIRIRITTMIIHTCIIFILAMRRTSTRTVVPSR